ncbi:hypothetical protein [Isoptericola sp. NPDC057391]|uniref:hypothetical protein n=1 Tax=Isoptericola sp. NPDC057391 TaxID=3346117 RepID=UPI00363A49DE
MKVTRLPCHQCGNDVVQLPIFNGSRRAFNAVAIEPVEGDTGALSEHWYPMRGKGALPGDMMAAADIVGRPYLTLHRCVPIADIARHSLMEIRWTPGAVKVDDLVLDQLHEYTYRWPTSWAHILGEHPSIALCGERMPGRRTNARERERLHTMVVCAQCMERLELSEESRGRALLQAVRDMKRADVESGTVRIDPASMGNFLRRRGVPDAPVHLAECAFIRTSVFVPSEWEGFEKFPPYSSACPLCHPVKSLDERLADVTARRHQAEVAAAVHAAQDRERTDAAVAARREAERVFGALGTFVYRPAGRGKKRSQVHHFTCAVLTNSDSEGWVGTDSPPVGLTHHYCTEYI